MDSKEKKLVVVLLCIAFAMLIAGCFFVPFVVHVWTYIANLAGEKDMFLACTLFAYFTIFALLGAALGLVLYGYGAKMCKGGCGVSKKLGSLFSAAMKNRKKTD